MVGHGGAGARRGPARRRPVRWRRRRRSGEASGGGEAARGGAGHRRRGRRRRRRPGVGRGGGGAETGRGGSPWAWRARRRRCGRGPRGGAALAEAGGGVERTLSGAGRTRPSAAEEGDLFFLGFETWGSGIWRRGL